MGSVLKGALAGAAIGTAFKSVVSAASDAQQSLGATETVFGKFSDSVIKDSKKAATQFGLDASTYRENANLLGALFSNQGVAAKELGGATKEMIGVGADLAATFGGTTTTAVESLSAAFKGEFDSLEKYGISLKASKISAELAARGQDKLTGSALAAATQQVTADLIMQQSSKTRGAFAKETNTLAHQQQVLGAKLTNLKATIGSALLPVVTKFVAFVSDKLLPAITKWGGVFQRKVLPVIKDVAKEIGDKLGPVIANVGDFMKKNKPVVAAFAITLGVLATAFGVVAAVTAVWNAILAVNPISLVVIAIAALVAALVYAYRESETFKNVVDKAFKAIKAVTQAVFPVMRAIIVAVFKVVAKVVKTYVKIYWKVISTTFKTILKITKVAWAGIKKFIISPIKSAYQTVKTNVGRAKDALRSAWDNAKKKTKAVWDGIKEAVGKAVNKVKDKVGEVKDKVTGVFKNAGTWLVESGKDIIRGLWEGIKAMGDWLRDKVTALVIDKLPKAVQKVLGIQSPSKVFEEIGRFTVQGMAVGLKNSSDLRKVRVAGSGITTALGSGLEAPSVELDARGRFGGTGGNTYHITIKGDVTTDKAALGRQLQQAIDEFERKGGRKRSR